MKRYLILAALLGISATAYQRHPIHAMSSTLVAIDGDTFKDTNPRHRHYRLVKIDAPEMPGHCRPGRHCVAGDPYAAKAALQAILSAPPIRCRNQGIDVYHRMLVTCIDAHGHDIGDELLATGLVSLYRRS